MKKLDYHKVIKEKMMSKLTEIKCEACRPGASLATEEQIKEYMPLIPDWEIIEEDGIRKLKRVFSISNFFATMKFVNAIADIANEEDHHPVMVVEYSSVTIFWWSHKIKGLHLNDFVMSAKSDVAFMKIDSA